MSERQLVISARQAELCEEAALRLMREGRDVDGMRLMSVSLAYKFARDVQPLPTNVVPLEAKHSVRV